MGFKERVAEELAALPVFFNRVVKPSSFCFERNMSPFHDFPFQKNDKAKFIVRNSIPVFDCADSKDVAGIIIYDIRPETWTLIYCHTTKLRGYETQMDGGDYTYPFMDYFEVPFELIRNKIELYRDVILQECDKVLQGMEDTNPAVNKLLQTMLELDDCSSKDFTVDIYIPPRICDLTGERYFRPGGRYNRAFDNPVFDVDRDATKGFLEYLHHAVTNEMPEHGLVSQYDRYLDVFEQMGGFYSEDDDYLDNERRKQDDTRVPHTHNRRQIRDWDRFTSRRLGI